MSYADRENGFTRRIPYYSTTLRRWNVELGQTDSDNRRKLIETRKADYMNQYLTISQLDRVLLFPFSKF